MYILCMFIQNLSMHPRKFHVPITAEWTGVGEKMLEYIHIYTYIYIYMQVCVGSNIKGVLH